MKPDNQRIAQIIYDALKLSFDKRNEGKLINNNPMRSAYFVSNVATNIHKTFFSKSKLNVQSLEDIDSNKQSGEWLFDFCITEQCPINDIRYGGNAEINTKVLFAGESEFHTSIEGFGKDFGKLICSDANQYCYIQGLNQKTEEGRRDFIQSRKEIITKQINHFIQDDFVLAFVPTPGKGAELSFWDEHENDVLGWTEIYIYDKSANDLIKFVPK